MDPRGKNILFVITKSNWGGAQRNLYDLALGLRERGARVRVAYGGKGEAGAPQGRLAELLQAAGIEGVFVESFMRDISFSREFPALFELIRIFKRERPDIVHLHSSKAGGIGALAARIARVPKIVFTVHGLPHDEDRALISRVLIWLATWATFLLSHSVIVLTEDARERAKHFPGCGHKVRLVHNGIPDVPLLSQEEARAKLAPHGDTGVPWIGTISELTKNKGVEYLLEAARLLRVREHAFFMCIIGGGESQETLMERVRGYGLENTVHFAGFVPDAARYLSAFDIFTLTSVKEGQPYVLLEAAQAGCAVVASRIPGVSDMVDNHTGLLVTPKNPVAIADALAQLLADGNLRQTLGTAFRLETARSFSLSRMIEGTLEAYA